MAHAMHISVICDHNLIVKRKPHNEPPWGRRVHTLDFSSLFFSLSFPPPLFLFWGIICPIDITSVFSCN